MNRIHKKVIERIKKERLRLKLTQASFGDSIGVDQGQFSKIEKGTIHPTFQNLISMKEVFGISMSYLFGESDKESSLEKNEITTTNISGDGSILNTGEIGGESVFISTSGKEKDLKKRIKELEEEVRQLREDKAYLQKLVSLIEKNNNDS